MPHHPQGRHFWAFVITAAAILGITMGVRQVLGLFVSPLNTSTGLGIVSISFALAVGQFVWGAAQPIFGVVADRYGPARVIALGGIMLALGVGLTPFVSTEWSLVLMLGVVTAAGAGAGSFSILFAAIAHRLPAERRAFASGFINAGGSFGQFVFAPLIQVIISAAGWVSAMLSMAALALATVPMALPFRRRRESRQGISPTAAGTPPAASASAAPPPAPAASGQPGAQAPAATDMGLRRQLRVALKDRSYLLLHAGFFTCGFHIAFLVTHLPIEVQLCGLPASVSANSLAIIGLFNIAGSLTVGVLAQRYRMKMLLTAMYASRAVMVLAYLLAPKTALTFYVFAAALGFTWLATVPPTAGLVGKLFGTRYLATLFGLTLLSHQIGGFLGAWLGGIAVATQGDYTWMWYADILLAAAAALLHLPIREARVRPTVAQPA